MGGGERGARAVLEGHTGRVYAIAFSPDGATLASGAGDHTVRLWEVASGRERAVLRGHTDEVRAIAFSPDGATLASGSGDHTVRLWEVASGRERAVLRGHTDEVRAIAFSPDGATLLLALTTARCGCGRWRAGRAGGAAYRRSDGCHRLQPGRGDAGFPLCRRHGVAVGAGERGRAGSAAAAADGAFRFGDSHRLQPGRDDTGFRRCRPNGAAVGGGERARAGGAAGAYR